eukprot:5621693-Amphidinium_carterae.1
MIIVGTVTSGSDVWPSGSLKLVHWYVAMCSVQVEVCPHCGSTRNNFCAYCSLSTRSVTRFPHLERPREDSEEATCGNHRAAVIGADVSAELAPPSSGW